VTDQLFSARSVNDPESDRYGQSNHASQANFAAYGNGGGPVPSSAPAQPTEKEVNMRDQYGLQGGEDSDPLQLEHMMGFSGDYRKTLLCMPSNENLFARRYIFTTYFAELVYSLLYFQFGSLGDHRER
jgi:hypothetical protein